MATELITLVKDGKIKPTVTEQITLETIPQALERLAEGHVRGKIVAVIKANSYLMRVRARPEKPKSCARSGQSSAKARLSPRDHETRF